MRLLQNRIECKNERLYFGQIGQEWQYGTNYFVGRFSELRKTGVEISDTYLANKVLLSLRASRANDMYDSGHIAARITHGYIFLDRVNNYDGSVQAKGRIRFKTDLDGNNILYLDNSNF